MSAPATYAERFRAWVERHVAAPDPDPEYSALDRRDGLGHDLLG